MNNIEVLAEQIIFQAVADYRRALRGTGVGHRKPKTVIKECEKFFRSEWYGILTNVDGELIISKLRKEYDDECNTNTINTRPYRKHH